MQPALTGGTIMTITRLHSAPRLATVLFSLAAAFSVTAGAALADAPDPAAKDRGPARVVILGEDDQHVTLTFDGNQLQIVGVDRDEVEVTTIDLEELGQKIDEAVSAAMQGLETALEALAFCSISDGGHQAVVHRRRAPADHADLQAEIAELKAEIAQLRAELKRQR
jgi:hypothetical protein